MNELELQRRENLKKIAELGFEPFPAAMVEVDFDSQEITTPIFHKRFAKQLEALKGIGEKGAEKLREAIFQNQSKAQRLLGNEEIAVEFGLAETVEFDQSLGKAPMDLQTFIDEAKAAAIGIDRTVRIAGRFMGQRGPFAKLQDSKGQIQLYIGKKDLGESEEDKERYQKLVKLLDIGDFIGVAGTVFSTGTGEVSIKVDELTFLGKSLRTLPVVKRDKDGNVYDEFNDPELRYRMRYVDLTVNPKYKDIFIKRTQLIKAIRQYLDELGLMEVETPILQAIHGGAAARPFKTHHNTLDMPMYMRIANELYLKRLIVAGFDGVYEIGKMFRNEGMDRTHNPEFSMIEFYVAYKDYLWMMDRTEELFERVAMALHGKTTVKIGDKEVEFKGPYKRLTMYESIKEHTGETVDDLDEDGLRALCKKWHIEVDKSMGRGKLIDEIFGEKVEPHLIQPTFITDYPVEMSPLTKKHRSKEGLVERFELIVNGKEVANAYSELNDPIDQRARFEEQLELANRGDDEAMPLDEDFLRALEFGMPPTSGIGIGIDRLTMLMTGQKSIQEVLFFPQMRAERKKEV